MAELDWHAERTEFPGIALLDNAVENDEIDLKAVRQYRLKRVREQMQKREIDALILSDPVNIRYATGTRNMQIFSARNTPSRYLLVTEDRTILYEFTGCMHLHHENGEAGMGLSGIHVISVFFGTGPRPAPE